MVAIESSAVTSSLVEQLHATLARRETPETIAAMIAPALPVPGDLGAQLRKIAQASIRRLFGWSSMPTVFAQPASPARPLAKARELVQTFLGASLPDGDDLEDLEAAIVSLNLLIGKGAGAGDMRTDRLRRAARVEQVGLSRRRYTKLFRMATRLERRAEALREARAGLISP